jgi:diacylglycerol kinase family enzyme
MRALLVVNNFATTTNDAMQKLITEALCASLDLTVIQTQARNDATQIAMSACSQGYDLIIGLGGDGTVNELANGLLADGPNPDGPILAAIPGGNANVFARNMGFANDPIVATNQLLEAVRERRYKTIGVGKITSTNFSRWFLFNSGIGLDAAVLVNMEARRAAGKRASDASYAALAVRELFVRTNRKKPVLSLVSETGQTFNDAYFALIVNLAPWAYLGKRALDPAPNASHETSLNVFAPTSLSVPAIFRMAKHALRREAMTSNGNVIALINQEHISFVADRSLWVQVDGDVVAQTTEVTARHIPNALRVLA